MKIFITSTAKIVLLILSLKNTNVISQYYSSYYSRAHGPVPYDFFHQKPISFQSPINFNVPHHSHRPKPPPKEYNNIFSGPPTSPIKPPNETNPKRENRFLSLFTVVQFPKETCVTNSGDNGTCLSPPDCQHNGGIVTNPCANNFGVCCVFMATCGQTTRDNGTYFVNKGYPAGFNGTTTCQLTINKMQPDICQYRLDFELFTLASPEPNHHICNYDQFIVSGSTPVPTICGYNTGNHMYIDAGLGTNGPVVLSMITSGTEIFRQWKIRITQIPCLSNYKADDSCLQYFTGISGTIKSFNYEPVIGLHLSNQDYSICIRTERNFCGIQYSQCTDTVNNHSHAFTLTGNTLGENSVQSMVGSTGQNSCNMDWLMIPCMSNVGKLNVGTSTCVDRICGGILNTEISVLPSTVYSTVKPFRLVFHTNNVELPTDMGNRGFCINYVQQPCNNAL